MPLSSWALIENLPGVLYVYDRHGHFLKWNRNFERVSGYSADEIRRMVALDFIDRRHRDLVASRIEDVFSRGTASVEANIFSKDGTTTPYLLTGDRVEIDGDTCVFGMGIDISERVRFEHELHEHQSFLKMAQRVARLGAWSVDVASGVPAWSDQVRVIYDLSPEAVPRADDAINGYAPEEQPKIREALKTCAELGEPFDLEARRTTAAGENAWIRIIGEPVRDAEGTITRIQGAIQDVTNLRLAQEERKKLEAQFLRAQRLESIGTLAGGIAHDLNNILSPILMAVGLLKADGPSAQQIGLLDTIEISGRRGSDMVRQVLGFARGVEGKRVEVNVRHLFRDVQKILKETIPKNIDVSFTAPADLWTVNADVTQLNQVLMNLCVNARDAMPDGGRLTVAAENLALDEVYTGMLGELSPGPYLVITAADSGMGMSRDTQERIFEPFFTTKELGKGTGLGLSTVLTIVKAHTGAIDVKSQIGTGTTFRIFLPALHAAAASTPTSDIPLPHGSGETILVVDDEEHIRSLTQKTLERHDYNVLVASNGAHAVALYAQHRDIAVVLTDMVMPVMDGGATIAALKAINPLVRVIASSGHSTDDAHAKAVAAGVAAFIDKPYTVDTLVRMVHDVLHAPSAGQPHTLP